MLSPELKESLRESLARHPQAVDVTFSEGEVYEIAVRGHRLRVDQPRYQGTDSAPTPVELFVASLASCMAYYAGRYLARHHYTRGGLAVHAEYTLSETTPHRVEAVKVVLTVPKEVPPERLEALTAFASQCTVHNSLRDPPRVDIEIST